MTKTKNAVVKATENGDNGNGILPMWQADFLAKTRKLFAPTLSETEFLFFVSLGKKYGADPRAGEIWPVKYGDAPAAIFLGKNFYLKKAQEQPDYNGHRSACVYENDIYKPAFDGTGKITMIHEPARKKDRGKLESAYCIVHRKGIDTPFFVTVDIDECNKDAKGNPKGAKWKTEPAVMLEKVALSRCLRLAFYSYFKGTYAGEEQSIIEASAGEEPSEFAENGTNYPDEPPAIEEEHEEIIETEVEEVSQPVESQAKPPANGNGKLF